MPSYKIQILDPAKQDLVEGYNFYEEQEPGIGRYFLDCLYADIDSLTEYAGIHPKEYFGFYWMQSKRFPFAIHYDVGEGLVSVYAILDCRQDPSRIQARMKWEWREKDQGI